MKTSIDHQPEESRAWMWPHHALGWLLLSVIFVGATVGCIVMAGVAAPSVFPWLPAGIAAGLVLRFDWRFSILGGLALGVGLMSMSGPMHDDPVWLSTVAASHMLGLALLPLAMGESGRRLCASRIRSVDAARLVLLGIPVVVLPTGLLWVMWSPTLNVGQMTLSNALPTSLLLGLLAGIPVTVKIGRAHV